MATFLTSSRLASASCRTLAASRSSSGAGALTRRLVQDSRGEDVGGHLVVLDPHGGGAGVDRHPLCQLPLFRADDGVGKALTFTSFNVARCDLAKGENTS